LLHLDPVAHLPRQRLLALRIVQHVPDTVGEEGRERKLSPCIGWNFRVLLIARPNHQRIRSLYADEPQDFAGEEERIAGRQAFDKIFLDLPETAARDQRRQSIALWRARTRARPHAMRQPY